MPRFFPGTNRGWVRKLQSPAGSAGALVSGLTITSCLITRVAVAEQTVAQFQQTFGNNIYAYPFGDSMGEMIVSGMAYRDCDLPRTHGLDWLTRWYRLNKVSRSGRLISVTIGMVNYDGYLLGFKADANKVDEMMVDFSLQFATIPDESSLQ